MHGMPIRPSVKAIGRAGAGTNNIPVAAMSQRGIPVFNAPGANANAVKELVLAALLIAARNVIPGVALRRRSRSGGARSRAAGGGGQEAVRRRRAAAPYARDRRPGRDREPRRRYRDQARDEGRRLRSRDHRRCRVAASVEREAGAQRRGAPEAVGFRHASCAAARFHAQSHRRVADCRDESRRRAAQFRARRARRRDGIAGGAATRASSRPISRISPVLRSSASPG